MRSTHWPARSTGLSEYDFPMRTNPVTRAYFAQTAALVGDPTVAAEMRAVSASEMPDSAAAARLAARSAFYNAQLRTTCVATLLQGGHAENALPQMAQATVNCRMLPGTNPSDVDATIRRVIARHVGRRGVAPSRRRQPALGAAACRAARDSASCNVALGNLADRAEHGDGCHRWPLPAECGLSGLRREWPLCGSHHRRRQPRARPQRAYRRAGVLRSARIHVSPLATPLTACRRFAVPYGRPPRSCLSTLPSSSISRPYVAQSPARCAVIAWS